LPLTNANQLTIGPMGAMLTRSMSMLTLRVNMAPSQ
jgi:hypothetical protein